MAGSNQFSTKLGLFLVVAFLGGIWLGQHPQYLPPFSQARQNPDQLAFEQSLTILQREYYLPVSRADLLNSSISGQVAGLHDRFSRYLTPANYLQFQQDTDGAFGGIGVTVGPEKGGLLIKLVKPNAPAYRAGLRAGDVITTVNGRVVRLRDFRVGTDRIRGQVGTMVRLTVKRNSVSRAYTLKRAEVRVPSARLQLARVAGHKLAVITMSGFTTGVATEVGREVERAKSAGARAVVLDLRGNGGGLISEAVDTASVFVPTGPIVSIAGRAVPRRVYVSRGRSPAARLPVVVLVDNGTASAAEIVAGALHDRRHALVVGEHTYGKGVFQQIERLVNGGALDITVGEYFTPSGHNLGGGGTRRGAGIQPDVVVSNPDHAVKDRQLHKALAVLTHELSS
jgi:carboxyl-terminal processing protease